ncbi:kinesin-like protein [Plakobranchus ocellatus]|uniref:Kinesin-like protein n=1 Tax=Plakobranchus ocellatus TaxID=259542 RepID=A0AAV4BNV8_9GAST|nr:kinesin-like protein [Plakobranchus ocellatus]
MKIHFHSPFTFSGYNCSLFAYGQTGSGKSYSMVGYGSNKGIVPITCDELFKTMAQNQDDKKVSTDLLSDCQVSGSVVLLSLQF